MVAVSEIIGFEQKQMKSIIRNYSSLADWEVSSWFTPRFLQEFVEEAVILPDVCPAGIVPNGTVALVRPQWLDVYRFSDAIADIGCAMSLAPVPISLDELPMAWNDLYCRLRALGKTILGSGNHFIDACVDEQDSVHVLIHMGSRMTTEEKNDFRFGHDYLRYSERAVAHHSEIWQIVRAALGGNAQPLHIPHDSAEHDGRWLMVRKGVTHSPPGAPILIASSFDDIVTVGTARTEISILRNSMCHGTGRIRVAGKGEGYSCGRRGASPPHHYP